MIQTPAIITLLQPTWSEARVSKTFSKPVLQVNESPLDPVNANAPNCISGYNLGEQFRHKTIEAADLNQLKTIFQKAADLPVFRIYGQPATQLPETVARTKENFREESSCLFHVDADGWRVPRGFSSLDPNHWEQFLPRILNQQGLEPLNTADCLILQSASAWRTDQIRAHLYFFLTEPLDLETLRGWALAHNAAQGHKSLDGAVYRSVQPDFIGRRVCENFKDPLPDEDRLFIVQGLSDRIDTLDLLAHIDKTLRKTGFSSLADVGKGSGQATIGHDWEATLSLCGGVQGINDPAYRAAAQLVQSVGNAKVRKELAEYVERMFIVLWDAVRSHNPDPTAENARGGTNDIRAYDRTKIRGYITTALNKHFGDQVDKDVERIYQAIDDISAGTQSPSFMFEPDTVAAVGRIKKSHAATWADIREALKTRLRGKVSLSELVKALPTDKGGYSNENEFINEVIEGLEWILDPDGGMYCKQLNASTGYSLIPLEAGVKDVLFLRGLEVSGNTCSIQFPAKAMAVLCANSLTPEKTNFEKMPVRRRVWAEQDRKKRATWLNMGRQADGRTPLIKILEKPPYVQIKDTTDCPVLWRTEETVAPITLPKPEQIMRKYGLVKGEDRSLLHSRCIQHTVKELKRFIACDEEDYPELLTWCVLSVLDQSLSYLLQMVGAPQSGKSTAADFLQSLIDPQTESVTASVERHPLYKDKQTLHAVLSSRYITIFDNLSNLTPQQQDLLCQVLTGYKISTRIYYTQKYVDKIIKKPMVLTTIEDLLSRSDLRSRSMTLSFSKSRFEEDDIEQKWDVEKPYLFFGLCHLGGEVLEESRKMLQGKSTGLGRDFWATAARRVIAKWVYPDLSHGERDSRVKEESRRRMIEATVMHSRTAMLLAWIHTDERFTGSDNTRYEEYTSTMYQWFIEWVNAHAGLTVDVFGHTVGIIPGAGPKTVRGFGAFISQGSREVHKITGWDLSQHQRDSNGIRRIFDLTRESTKIKVNPSVESSYEDLI